MRESVAGNHCRWHDVADIVVAWVLLVLYLSSSSRRPATTMWFYNGEMKLERAIRLYTSAIRNYCNNPEVLLQ